MIVSLENSLAFKIIYAAAAYWCVWGHCLVETPVSRVFPHQHKTTQPLQAFWSVQKEQSCFHQSTKGCSISLQASQCVLWQVVTFSTCHFLSTTTSCQEILFDQPGPDRCHFDSSSIHSNASFLLSSTSFWFWLPSVIFCTSFYVFLSLICFLIKVLCSTASTTVCYEHTSLCANWATAAKMLINTRK